MMNSFYKFVLSLSSGFAAISTVFYALLIDFFDGLTLQITLCMVVGREFLYVFIFVFYFPPSLPMEIRWLIPEVCLLHGCSSKYVKMVVVQ